jgi:hypothetical protein
MVKGCFEWLVLIVLLVIIVLGIACIIPGGGEVVGGL